MELLVIASGTKNEVSEDQQCKTMKLSVCIPNIAIRRDWATNPIYLWK